MKVLLAVILVSQAVLLNMPYDSSRWYSVADVVETQVRK